MTDTNNSIVQNILFSCEQQKSYATEQVVPEHVLVYVVTGNVEFQFNNEKYIAEPQDIVIIRRNQLVKALKIPGSTGVCKTINIFLTEEVIRKYAVQYNPDIYRNKQEKYFGRPLIHLSKNKFIKAYFDSLLPYFNCPEKLNGKMARLKTAEAIELLLDCNHNMEQFLFDLSEPYKIDLEKFCNENFMFNISIAEFARLTGRSLSTFKRDFKTIYNNTPEKWLKAKRLDEAKYLINQKKQKPSDVYYHVGFENFSHFSTAYKQRFGHNASEEK